MKNFYLLLVGVLLLTSCGNSHINSFYHKHRWKKGVINFNVPGWLIYLGTGVVYEGAKDAETKMLMKLGKKVKGIRVMVTEDRSKISQKSVDKLIRKLRGDNFDDLIYIKDGTSKISIMGQERKLKIRNLFIMVEEEEELVMLNLRTKLKLSEVAKLIKEYQKQQKKESEKAAKKKKKERLPAIPEVPKIKQV